MFLMILTLVCFFAVLGINIFFCTIAVFMLIQSAKTKDGVLFAFSSLIAAATAFLVYRSAPGMWLLIKLFVELL